ncbi:MAG TPA: rRNA maturation RNase YbeY [Thermodesulfobacteriota bacterium]|nr:rRNA maturation RNase YbeY [Thermodesulfobacteriota bacterium]
MKAHIVDYVDFLNKEEKRKLRNHIKLILKHLRLASNKDLCITFLDDKGMKELNSTYRGIKRTTDVLSFPQDGPDIRSLGDIIISADTAKKHARFYKISLQREITKLIIHGILHILGYDHKKKNDANKMRKKEKELLQLVNFS